MNQEPSTYTFAQYFQRICIELLLLMGVGALILYGTAQQISYLLGWLWGSIANLVYVSLLAYTIRKVAGMPSHEGVRFMKRTVVVRFSLIVFALIVALLVPQFNVIATGIGLLGYKLILNVDHLLFRHIYPK